MVFAHWLDRPARPGGEPSQKGALVAKVTHEQQRLHAQAAS
ncbi:hypothetical protein [Alloactinosynnema sp. L-07]|nr:hypothetical protein [Alloactinosynnema sp. L-07]